MILHNLQVWRKRIKWNVTQLLRDQSYDSTHTHCFDCFIWSPTSFFLLLKRSVHLRIKSLENACEASLTSPQLRRDRTQRSGLYSRWRARQQRIHSPTDSAILDCGERITCRVPGACPPEAGAHSQSSPPSSCSHLGWEELNDSDSLTVPLTSLLRNSYLK